MRKIKTLLKDIRVGALCAGLPYQRKLNDTERCKQIADNWNYALFEYPKISYRDGTFNIIDGQHTVVAFILKFGYNAKIKCLVATGLTKEDESQWFAELNTRTKKQSFKAIYTSKILGNQDSESQQLVNDLNKCGLSLCYPNKKRIEGSISAFKTIIDLHNKMNQNEFIECFGLLAKVWKGETSSLTSDFLKGWKVFYQTFAKDWNEKKLYKNLSCSTPTDIKTSAYYDLSYKDKSKCYAKELLVQYNGTMRGRNKLDITKLSA